MRKKYLCILICLFANALAFASAANRTITGVVISGEDNEPLIGASVYVNADDLKKAGASQTSLGTITDMDGKFSISIPEKEAVVRKVFPEAVQNLLCVLCKNAETADVPEIFQAFYEKKRQSESCVHAVVEYVTPLTEAQQEGLKQFAMKVTGKQQAVLTMQKNPALRGGFVLRIGDLVYDRSLRNTLKTLQKKLAGQ